MASGKICIAANEGGCKETVVQNKTGYLIHPTEQKLIDTVRGLKRGQLLKMKNECILQAKKFDIKNTVNQWKELIST
jgi:glycosyltransferase involved in cell wall biosynthesis